MRALVFDWETSGLTLHPHAKAYLQPRVIEFGAVLVNKAGEILREWWYLIDPEFQIDADIQRITKIKPEDLAGQPKFINAYPYIREAFAEADIAIAHNLPFDRRMWELECNRVEVPFVFPQQGLCTVQCHYEEWGKRPKLGDLYEDTFGRKMVNAHRATDDCRALAEIVVEKNLLALF